MTALICACSASPRAENGLLRLMVSAQVSTAQITSVSVTITPAGLSNILTPNSDGTFTWNVTVPVGQQSVAVSAFSGTTRVGAGGASANVTKGTTTQLAIKALDVTGPAPPPDHSPVIAVLSVSGTTARVGGQLSVNSTAVDADGDPIAYAWTTAPAGCGTFAAPTSASTTFTAAATGTCVLTITATANARSDTKSLSVLIGPAGPAFPLLHSANNRYLVDQLGTPVPILGRAAWFVLSLTASDSQLFLDDTLAKGFDAIEMIAITHDPRANDAPFANGGTLLPFTTTLGGATWTGSLLYTNIASDAPDFTKPDESYWQFVDAFVSACESKGILILLFPAYLGFTGHEEGWMQEMIANGPTRINTYGAFIANRYRNNRNIVWMMGGDYMPSSDEEKAAESALIAGLQSVSAQQSVEFSAEWADPSVCGNDPDFAAKCTLEGIYTFSGDVNTWGLGTWSDFPQQPAFLLEEPYDEEGPDGTKVNPSATQPVRRFIWWGWLSSIGGYVAGNGWVWPFRSGEWNDDAHLNSAGAQDLARLNSFVQSISWWNLAPSGLGGVRTLITSGGSTPSASDFVAAAADPSGSLLVAYAPPAHNGPFTVDVRAMAQPSRARWLDPTSGSFIQIGTGKISNTAPISFTIPGPNNAGSNDWVLILDPG